MSSIQSLIAHEQARFNHWLCARFGHKETMVVDVPWKKGGLGPYGIARYKKHRHVHCARCKKEFVEWEGLR